MFPNDGCSVVLIKELFHLSTFNLAADKQNVGCQLTTTRNCRTKYFHCCINYGFSTLLIKWLNLKNTTKMRETKENVNVKAYVHNYRLLVPLREI